MRFRFVAALGLSLLSFLNVPAYAAGFSEGVSVWHGDINGDGKKDLYIKTQRKVVPIPFDDISIPIVTSPPSFLLQNDGAGSFTIVPRLSASQQNAVSQWPQATSIDVNQRDIDIDRLSDLEIEGINTLIPGAFDHIVYAAGGGGAPPSVLTSMNSKFLRYHEQVFGWLKDSAYFDKLAPLAITSAEPAQRIWAGSVITPTNVGLINTLLARCRANYPSSTCAISRAAPPPPCVRNVTLYDSFGNAVGTDTIDICSDPVQIIVYNPGQVTVEPDYSVFEPEARESVDILKRLNASCPIFGTSDEDRLKELEEIVYQRVFVAPVFGRVGDADTKNSVNHVPFPGDEIFNPSDVTFHHYDTSTEVCSIVKPNCNMQTVRDIGLRRFSYPAKQLIPNLTPIPGPPVMAYYTAPGFTRFPIAYVLQLGFITQRLVQAGPWAGASQNVTEVDHQMHPGTVSRYIEQKNDKLYIFSHGVGINRALCRTDRYSLPIQILRARGNDIYGPKAFKALDKEMLRFLKNNYGL